MKTEQPKKVIISVDTGVQQENAKNTRRGLKILQPTSTDKENLAGRSFIKDNKTSSTEFTKPRPMLIHKETQTEKYIVNIDDLTGEEASADYWKRVAEKRQESLDESLQEIEKLKGDIAVLQEENKVCKEMLDESRHLVKVFQEMLAEDENEETPDDETAATSESEAKSTKTDCN